MRDRLGASSPYVVTTALWAVTVGVLPATAIGTLAPFIVAESTLGRGSLGWLYAAFHFGGALCTILAGRMADAFGARRALMMMPMGLVVTATAVALSDGLVQMAVSMFACGVAFSASNPGTNKLVADNVPHGPKLGVSLGIKQGGIPFAVVLAGSVMTVGASSLGWRVSYLAGIVASCLLLFLLLIPIRAGSNTLKRTGTANDAGDGSALMVLAVFGFGMGSGLSMAMAYFVLYLVDADAGVGPLVAGSLFSAAGLLGMIARVGWSVVTVPGRQWKNLFVVSLGAALTGFLLALDLPLGPVVLGSLAILLGVFVLGWSGVFQVALIYESGPRVGRGSGIAYTGFGLGLMSGPSVFGSLLEFTGAYQLPWIASGVGFGIAVTAAAYGQFALTYKRRRTVA